MDFKFFFSLHSNEKMLSQQKKRRCVIGIKNVPHACFYSHVFLTSWFLRLLSAFLKPCTWVNVVLVNRQTVSVCNPFLWTTRCWEWTVNTTFETKVQPYVYELCYVVSSDDVPISNLCFPSTVRSLTLNYTDQNVHQLYSISHSLTQLKYLTKVFVMNQTKSGWQNGLDFQLFSLPPTVRTLHFYGQQLWSPLPYPFLRSCYLQHLYESDVANFEQSNLLNLMKLEVTSLYGVCTFPTQLVVLSLGSVTCPLSTSIFPRCLKVLRIHVCISLKDTDDKIRLPSNLEVFTLCKYSTLLSIWLPDSITYLKLTHPYVILKQLPQQLRVLKLHSLSVIGSFPPYPSSLEILLVNSCSFHPNQVPDFVKRIVISACGQGNWEIFPDPKWGKRLFHKHRCEVEKEECACPIWIPCVESVATIDYKQNRLV